MSYKVAVMATGEKGWTYNALRFSSREDAERYGQDLTYRWLAVVKYEVQEDSEPANSRLLGREVLPL